MRIEELIERLEEIRRESPGLECAAGLDHGDPGQERAVEDASVQDDGDGPRLVIWAP